MGGKGKKGNDEGGEDEGGAAAAEGGKGKGGKKGGGKGPPPKVAQKSAEEQAAERKAQREAEKAAIAKKKADEAERVKWLLELPEKKAGSIHGVKWATVKCQVLLAGGTTLVELADGSIVCVRRAADPAAEHIGNRVSQMAGIRVPETRLVHPTAKEYKEIKDMDVATPTYMLDTPMTLDAFVEELKDAHGGTIPSAVAQPVVKQLEYTSPQRCAEHLGCPVKPDGTITVMEFIQGRGFDESCGDISPEEIRALALVGCVAAVMNFPDQLVLPVFKESGKLTNMMRKPGGSGYEVVAIDTQVCHIADARESRGYVDRLTELVASVSPQERASDPSKLANAVKNPNRDLLVNGGYHVDDSHMEMLLDGLHNGFAEIGKLWHSGALPLALRNASEECSGTVPFNKEGITLPTKYEEFVNSTGDAVRQAVAVGGQGAKGSLFPEGAASVEPRGASATKLLWDWCCMGKQR